MKHGAVSVSQPLLQGPLGGLRVKGGDGLRRRQLRWSHSWTLASGQYSNPNVLLARNFLGKLIRLWKVLEFVGVSSEC